MLVPIALLVSVTNGRELNGGGCVSSTSRLPFVAGIDHNPVFGSIHRRYRTPWVAIAVYGLASVLVAILGQMGTTVRGAYDVLVSMAVISYFIPYLLLFAAMIRLQWEPAEPNVRRVPGKKPVAIVLGVVGFAATATTIVLSLFPGADQPDKVLAVVKVVGATAVQLGLGVASFAAERRGGRLWRCDTRIGAMGPVGWVRFLLSHPCYARMGHPRFVIDGAS